MESDATALGKASSPCIQQPHNNQLSNHHHPHQQQHQQRQHQLHQQLQQPQNVALPSLRSSMPVPFHSSERHGRVNVGASTQQQQQHVGAGRGMGGISGAMLMLQTPQILPLPILRQQTGPACSSASAPAGGTPAGGGTRYIGSRNDAQAVAVTGVDVSQIGAQHRIPPAVVWPSVLPSVLPPTVAWRPSQPFGLGPGAALSAGQATSSLAHGVWPQQAGGGRTGQRARGGGRGRGRPPGRGQGAASPNGQATALVTHGGWTQKARGPLTGQRARGRGKLTRVLSKPAPAPTPATSLQQLQQMQQQMQQQQLEQRLQQMKQMKLLQQQQQQQMQQQQEQQQMQQQQEQQQMQQQQEQQQMQQQQEQQQVQQQQQQQQQVQQQQQQQQLMQQQHQQHMQQQQQQWTVEKLTKALVKSVTGAGDPWPGRVGGAQMPRPTNVANISNGWPGQDGVQPKFQQTLTPGTGSAQGPGGSKIGEGNGQGFEGGGGGSSSHDGANTRAQQPVSGSSEACPAWGVGKSGERSGSTSGSTATVTTEVVTTAVTATAASLAVASDQSLSAGQRSRDWDALHTTMSVPTAGSRALNLVDTVEYIAE